MSLVRDARDFFLIVKNGRFREEKLISIFRCFFFFFGHEFNRFRCARTYFRWVSPLARPPYLWVCAPPQPTLFPFTYHFFVCVRSYRRVPQLQPHFPGRQSFQDAFNNQIDIFYNLHRRRGSYFRFPYIRFSPPAISFGCSKTESHIPLPPRRFPSPSSAKWLETQWKREGRSMSLFRLFS